MLRSPASQFHLLLLPYELSLPSDTVFADEAHAFQEVPPPDSICIYTYGHLRLPGGLVPTSGWGQEQGWD